MISNGPEGPFLVGIDVGSQSVRALLADRRGTTLAVAHRPTPVRVLGQGRAEYDLTSLWRCIVDVLTAVALHVPSGGEVAGMAVASVGEACVLLDDNGQPLADAMTWFDRRTEGLAARLARDVGADRLFDITGLPLDPTFTLCKLLWYREATPDVFRRTVRVLNIADWVAYRLCGEPSTDLSLASRTFCLDLAARSWSQALLAEIGLAPELLPPIRRSGAALGPVRAEVLSATGLPGRPIVGVGGHDHVVGGFAAGSARPGCLLDSMGTAEALFLSVEQPPLTRQIRELGFAQGAVGLHRPLAYIGAGINASGGAVEWFRALVDGASHGALLIEAEHIPPGSNGACFLPHLAYSPPPAPDTRAAGAFVGLTAATGRGAMFRSILEGLALQARQMEAAVAALAGVRSNEIRVIGGSTQNPLFLRIKASAYGRPLVVVNEPEATGLGAALLGGIAAGVWPDLDAALPEIAQERHVVDPEPDWTAIYDSLYREVFTNFYPAVRPIHHALAEMALPHAA